MSDRTKNSIKPFWSWNDKLDPKELTEQIEIMKAAGIEGFFMHARGGLKTEYMSEEWFDAIKACLDKADELGMQAWAYDENGWPSGFGDGKVCDLGIEHQQKIINLEIAKDDNFAMDYVIAVFSKIDDKFVRIPKPKKGSYVFYYTIKQHYIDVFNSETISYFLKFIHEEYYKRFGDRFGTSLKGFFTDEPQFSPNPWSFVFEGEFEEEFGYSLTENIPALFFEIDGYEKVRNDFNSMVARLFRENFIKQVYDWCEAHNCKLTGHAMAEDSIIAQLSHTNGVMPLYEYFQEPGIDYLGRYIITPITAKQLGSVAKQLDKKTLTETFALCGWDVSLNELKWIAQWQFLNGVTSVCPHLEGYSLKGERKRDYPASLFTHLPWFKDVNCDFADHFTSLGALFDKYEDVAPVLVIHPMQSAFITLNFNDRQAATEYSGLFDKITAELIDKHILHHYGDEIIMQNHALVDSDALKVGKCSYNAVLMPNLINLKSSTVKLLLAFIENGGRVYSVGRLPEFEEGVRTENIGVLTAKTIKCKDLDEFISLCKQSRPAKIIYKEDSAGEKICLNLKNTKNGKLLYLINNAKCDQNIAVEIQGEYSAYLYDVVKETRERIFAKVVNDNTVLDLHFCEYESKVILLENGCHSYSCEAVNTEAIPLSKEFNIKSCSKNAITLDKCRYKVDDGEWQDEIAVLNLQNKLLELKRPCDVILEFEFDISEEFDFSTVSLCIEEPEILKIFINGLEHNFVDEGYFVDKSIRCSNIGKHLKLGKNTITFSLNYYQSDFVYYTKFTPGISETLRNKLTYDTELESIYIIGDFGVKLDGDYHYGERRCIHAGKKFSLVKPVNSVDITDITEQNFWFFTGKMQLSQTVNINKENDKCYLIAFKELNAPACRIFVNGSLAGNIAFSPFSLDITKLLNDGENEIIVEMLSGNRNLLGPHHRPYGESYSVGPATFSDKNGWSDDKSLPPWTDNYSFVLFGITL